MDKRRLRAVEVVRATRSTEHGAFEDSHIYSMETTQELPPQKCRSVKRGHHGAKVWLLIPGIYFEATVLINNAGKGGWSIGILTITDELKEYFEEWPKSDLPAWLMSKLPKSALV